MENTYLYRHFLMCNALANKMQNIQPQNYAKLIIEQNNGRFMNSQMTCFFENADTFLSELVGNDEGLMWDELDMQEIAEMSVEQLQKDYNKFCNGRMKIQFINDED
jgi:hypothetical protein